MSNTLLALHQQGDVPIDLASSLIPGDVLSNIKLDIGYDH